MPIARWDSIRAILSITTINNYELRQIDLKTAYLNGPLDEEIYMRAPPRLDAPFWHLCKGVYGLCQAGRQWYLTLHQMYSELNYTWCESDWSMYTRNIDGCVTISATSVNDILLATNSKAVSDSATTELNKKFSITDGGNTEWLLGCRITRWRPNRILKVDQEQFLVHILHEFGMESCNSTVTPCPKWRLTSDMSPSTEGRKNDCVKPTLLCTCWQVHVPIHLHSPRYILCCLQAHVFYVQLRTVPLQCHQTPPLLPAENLAKAWFMETCPTLTHCFVRLLILTGQCQKVENLSPDLS